MLRLPTIRSRFEEIACAAEREQVSYLVFLAELVMTECDDRDRPRAARRSHGVGFPATSVDLPRARQPRSARWLLLLLSEMRAQQGRWSARAW